MRVYYLEDRLSAEHESFVHDAMDDTSEIQHVRIPHVLPIDRPTWSQQEYHKNERLLRAALKHAGIASDRDAQVLLVAPKQPYWYAVLINAIYVETGAYPWLIQTAAQREAKPG